MYGTRIGGLAEETIRTLTSAQTPYALPKRRIELRRYDPMAWKFYCLIHVVLLTNPPLRSKQYFMDSLLKRFNRHSSSEHDYVLVLTLKKDEIRIRTKWEQPAFNRVLGMMYPTNSLLLELTETETELEAENVGYKVERIDRMRFYCNEEEEMCWELAWPPPPPTHSNREEFSIKSSQFPQNKLDFESLFSRVVRDWRQNFNLWSIYLDEDRGSVDYLSEITHRNILNVKGSTRLIPAWFLVHQLAQSLNATLESRAVKRIFEQGPEILTGDTFVSVNSASFINHRILPVGVQYLYFFYAANASHTSGAANLLVFFSPFDNVAWALLAINSAATVILMRFAGNISPLDTLASFASQSIEVQSGRKLAPLCLLWSMFTLLIAAMYSGFIESALAVPAVESGMEDFKTLHQHGYRPVLNPDAKDGYNMTLRGFSIMDALLDRTDEQGFYDSFSPEFYKYLAENEKRFSFFVIKKSMHAEYWLNLARMYAPTLNWYAGKERIVFSIWFWTIQDPNAALLRYNLAILQSRGFLSKCEDYNVDRTLMINRRIKKSEEWRRGHAGIGQVGGNGEGVFRMHNPQVLALFRGFFGSCLLGVTMLLLECTLEIL